MTNQTYNSNYEGNPNYMNSNGSTASFEESLGLKARRYFYTIVSRWWLILLFLVAGSVAGYYRCMIKTPVYRSQCTYELISSPNLGGGMDGGNGNGNGYGKRTEEWVDRQIMLLTNSKVRKRTRDNLKPEWENRVPSDKLMPSVNVRKSGNISSMIKIQVDSVVKDYSLAYLEELLKVFEDFKQEQVLRHKEQTISKLREEKRKVTDDLEEAREELANFELEHNINFTRLKSRYNEEYLARLVQRQNALRMERTQLATQFPFLKNASSATIRDVLSMNIETHKLTSLSGGDKGAGKSGIDVGSALTEVGSNASSSSDSSSAATSDDTPWAGKEAKLLRLQAEYENKADLLRPSHPMMEDLKKRIKETEQELEIDAEIGLSRLRSRYKALKIQAESLDESGREWQSDVKLSSQEQAQYNQLKSKVAHFRNVHDKVYTRILNSSLIDVRGSYGYKIKEPYLYKLPVRPNKKKTMAFALIFALSAGTGFSLFLEKLRLAGPPEGAVERRFGIPFLLGIPNWKQYSRGFKRKKHKLLVSRHRHDIPTEVYRGLRSAVKRIIGERKNYIMMVTSDLEKTGKTLTCTNLGVVTAWTGKRVLLVDGDLRKGTLSRDLEINENKGLAQLLKGEVSNWHDLVMSANYENLEVMPAGRFSYDLPEKSGAPGRDRTCDPRIKSPLLCQLSYRRIGNNANNTVS